MSMVSELMREAPAYKKAVLAVAVTAGVGACVYLGYRQLSGPQTSDKPRGWSKSKEKSSSPTGVQEPSRKKEEHVLVKPESDKTGVQESSTKKEEHVLVKPESDKTGVREPSTKKEEHVLVKPETVKTDMSDTGTLDRSILTGKKDVHRTATPLKSEDLSGSVTFEKISIGAIESDNFEHVSMSQINPLGSSPAHKVEEKGHAQEHPVSSSSSSFHQPQKEAVHDVSLQNPQEAYENLSLSQADPSMSFLSTAAEELKEEEAKKSVPKQAVIQKTEEAGGSSNDDELASAPSVVRVKDENDIVVVETNEEESGLEKSEEERVSPRSGMAAIDVNFDSSRVSPVFGQQTYHRVDTEPEELVTFEPAKSHPASFGFRFESNI